MNVRDSEALSGLLQEAGFKVLDSYEGADVILFNTCSVRQHAEDKVFSEIGKLKKIKNQKSKIKNTNKNSKSKDTTDIKDAKRPIIGIIGCMAQNYKDEIFKRAPYVDLVVGPNDLLSVPLLIRQIIKEKSQALAVATMEREKDFYVSDFRKEKDHAYVVISEGCSNFCSYCVVPYVRGRLHCRNHHDILEEIRDTISSGIKNITLLGQNVNSYRDGDVDFVKLLHMVNDTEGLEQFSFLTSHPRDISEDLFPTMCDLDKLRKFLHLPVQAGSDRILKLMNRGYSVGGYRRLIERYRKIVKGTVTTDIIVGFPTETEDDFKETYSLMKDIRFDSAYIFKYSVRPHTQAERLRDDVSLVEKQRRHKILLDLQKMISKEKKCAKN
jgi:tRNA-2-methylthio-N6-dimethylallyladenosine synthase